MEQASQSVHQSWGHQQLRRARVVAAGAYLICRDRIVPEFAEAIHLAQELILHQVDLLVGEGVASGTQR